MLLKKIATLAIVSPALFAMLSCAATYHEYPDCVPYNYCPLPPLPHTFYEGCPTPVAEQFNQRNPETTVQPASTNVEQHGLLQ